MKKLLHPVKYLQSKLGKAYFIGLILPFLLISPFLFPAVSHADTVTVNIAAGSDDCREDAGTDTNFLLSELVNLMGGENDPDYDFNDTYTGGFRFTNITIPNGATINSATITFVPNNSASNVSTIIKGIAEDNTATWSAGSKPSQRTKTTATLAWSLSGVGPTPFTSPNIAAIVQEIVNRAGWVSGNAIGFAVEGQSVGAYVTNFISVRSYESGGSYPSLSITYTAAGGATTASPPRMMRLFEGFRIKFVSGRFIVQQK